MATGETMKNIGSDFQMSQSPHRVREGRGDYSQSEEGDETPDIAVKRELVRHEFEIPTNGRFGEYLRSATNPTTPPSLKVVAWQELSLLLFAFKYLKNIEEWRPTFETAMRYESALPSKDASNTRSRDSLFELYVASQLARTGIEVWRREPDIFCRRGDFEFTVAAKRIKSRDKLVPRSKAAREQIISARVPGIIALDISPLQPGFYESPMVESLHSFNVRLRKYMDSIFEPLLPEIERTCQRRQVFGVIAFALVTGMSDNGHSVHLGHTHSGHRLCDAGSAKAEQMWQVVDQLGRTLL
jgi:hypothetical protein